ncbi:MAG: molybdopterin-dependent oxidoreductase [Propionibacteriaceae bacterium]|nr:molybdopterin-dependent oxidoreductase [Propionibacteriaceae bacterium]
MTDSRGDFGETPEPDSSMVKRPNDSGARVVWSACMVNCGSRCPVRMVVVDGRIERIDPDDTGDDQIGSQQIRACVRGRSILQRIYSAERIKQPLKRVGLRGEGRWEPISWDQAFTEIAESLSRIIAEHGNESVYINYGTGVIGGTVTKSSPSRASVVARLMNCLGGFLDYYNDYSTGNVKTAVEFHYGNWVTSNSNDDSVNSRLVVMFGNNPHETRMSGGGEVFVTQEAKRQAGHRVIVIDPRYTDTAMNLADQWVPIRPGTDAALVAGLAHVMIRENLLDREFLDKYCSGFDDAHLPPDAPPRSSYESYVLGGGPDGVEKTPEWAAAITGVPVATIQQLAREIATTKPCAVNAGWGPQRHSNGENQARAPMVLAAMIGQVGIPGGGTGEREGYPQLPMVPFPTGVNPVRPLLPFFRWTDAIVAGRGMGCHDGIRDGANRNSNANVEHDITLGSNIKFIWNYASNALVNQHGDINRTLEILGDESLCEMIVAIDNQLSVSARYADIVLPDTTTAEQIDLAVQGSAGNMGYTILASRAIEPLYDSKPVYEQMAGIAAKLGVEEEFTEGRTQQDWVRWLLDQSRKQIPELPTFEELLEQGIWRKQLPSHIPLRDFRADPEAHPLQTPSGKIEIFSTNLYRMSQSWPTEPGQEIHPIPVFARTREVPGDPIQARYPLQCIGHHDRQRTHSTYGNSPWLREAHPHGVWMNPEDAGPRGIQSGDTVIISNDRGRVQLEAIVTVRIAPGVVSVPQGAWYQPITRAGLDVGGSVNVLTSQVPTAYAKANGQHSAFVEIRRAEPR